MPIVDVEVVCTGAELAALPHASVIATAAGTVFGSKPGQTWVKLRTLDGLRYGENEVEAPVPGPVFVTVTHARPPMGDALEDEVSALTTALASALERPAENVHIVYAPAGAGRIAFGGRVVR